MRLAEDILEWLKPGVDSIAFAARMNSLLKRFRFPMKMNEIDLPGLKPALIPLALCGG
jgi:hypothetical protein